MNKRLLLITTALALSFPIVQASALEGVVASVKPVHSLVSAVMEGVATPELLVRGAGSPHTYTMRPSEAGMLAQAKVVFWVGPDMEVFLQKSLETLAGGADVVTLSEVPGLTLLGMREGGAFETHSHGDDDHNHAHHDHDHAGEAEEAHDHDHDEGHAHQHAEAHEHGHGGKDAHIWLDPKNAQLMVRQIASTLSDADPENAAAYQANAAKVEERLDGLMGETENALASVSGKPFIVFHDAYQYFEHRFGLSAAGSITVSPEILPGAQRLEEIRERIAELEAVCVFAEPQFEPKLINVVIEGTGAHSGVLDPLGADIDDGPELYFTLIRNMSHSLAGCLSGE